MKKRIICLLLAVLMVMSLFSGLTTSAYAANLNGANTIQYTMVSGDYVLRICQKLGLNYYTCKPAIMALNNIQEGQWNKLAVGTVLTLPASDYDALLITNGAPTTTATSGAAYTTGTATTGTATAVATSSTINNSTSTHTADILVYYLVPYTMSIGETVSGVCNNLGVNFYVFQSFIKEVNDISSWSKVKAGQTLIVPTPVRPSVGTTCYGVMQHVVANNDTAYSICSAAGVNYNANKKLLEALNQTNNLGSIKAGNKFYYPLPMTVSVPGTGNPGGTATTTTTTTVTDGNGSTTTTTTSTAKLYKLTSNITSSDGTMLFYVNNQPVTAAAAGAKVTIVTDTASGKAIQSLTVKYSDGKADLLLASDTFIMPSCDVRVDAAMKTGHDIIITSNYSGKAGATVGGISVQSAVKGAAVVIKSTDPNYEIQSINAYYKKLVSSSTKTAITVSSSNAFIMPDADTYVEVTLKPVSTYAFYVNDPANGSFYLQVNGSSVTRAAKGVQVTVVAQAMDGYEPVSLTVFKHGSTTEKVNVFSNTFTMPAFDVDVTVRFAAKGNNILIMPSQFATVYAFKDPGDVLADAITERESGQTVYLKLFDDDDNEINAGYKVEYDVVRNSDGLKVKVKDEGALIYSFEMPKGGVTVTPIITSTTMSEITSKFFVNGKEMTPGDGYQGCSFSVTWNGKTSEFTRSGENVSTLKQIKSTIPEGEYIDLRFDCNDGMAFVKYVIEGFEEETNEANIHGYFKMPDSDITIVAYFETGKLPINYAAITGVGSVGYKDASGKSINSAKPGDVVTVNVVPGNGYKFDDTKYDTRLIITRSDNGVPVAVTKINKTTYSFTMPDVGVNVQIIFEPMPFVITMKCIDQKGNNLTGKGLWQIAINGVPGIIDNGVTKVDVAYGDVITVAMTEAGWSKYNMVSFRIDGNEYIADVLNYFYTFAMEGRWAKNLEIVATLKPSVPNNAASHKLSAYYDSTKGGVEFVILESPTQYSNDVRVNGAGKLNYIHSAYTGDKVAIVVTDDSKYEVKQGNVTVTSWFGTDADYIVPTEGWHSLVDGGKIYTAKEYEALSEAEKANLYHIFYFTMPDGDATANVSFSGMKKGISIHVRDKNNQPVSNMIRLQLGESFYDVAADDNFADIGFGTQVQLWRSNRAVAENKVITKSDIQTAIGPVSYYDLTGYYGGVWFSMPDQDVEIYLYIGDPVYYTYSVVWDQVYNGELIFRKTDNPADPICNLTDFAIGDTVYVWGDPDDGYDFLGIGDLKIMNGVNNLATLHKASTPEGPIWKFKLPNSALIFQATFQKTESKTVTLTLKIDPATTGAGDATEVNVTVGEYTTKMQHNGNISLLEGHTLTITSATDGYTFYRLQSDSNKGVSGNTYTVPDDLATLTDTLTVTLVANSNPIIPAATNGILEFQVGGSVVSEAADGATVEIYSTPNSGYKHLDPINLIVTKITDGTEVSVDTSSPIWTFQMPAGGVYVSALFEADNQVQVDFTVDGADAQLTISGMTPQIIVKGDTRTYLLEVGTKITITSATEGFDTVTVSTGTTYQSGKSVTYTVPDTADSGTITLSSSKNPITLGTVPTGCKLQCTDGTNVINSAATGDPYYIDVLVAPGYDPSKVTIVITNKADGAVTTYTTFPVAETMPAGGVDIVAIFEPYKCSITINIEDKDGNPSAAVLSVIKNNDTKNPLNVIDGNTIEAVIGDTLKISTVTSGDSISKITADNVPKKLSGATYTVTDLTSYGFTETLTVTMK